MRAQAEAVAIAESEEAERGERPYLDVLREHMDLFREGGTVTEDVPWGTPVMRTIDAQAYEDLLLTRRPLLDLRAPVEFARGAMPGDSLPLMTDDERAQVGTRYKAEGQAAAIALGHELVSGDVRSARRGLVRLGRRASRRRPLLLPRRAALTDRSRMAR